MDISEIVKKTGIPASKIRFYEEKKLIHSIGRHGLKRVFDNNIIEQLSLIALGQTAGLSLDEIANMLGSKGQTQIDRQLLLDKADQLDNTIKKMITMRDGLRHVAVCSAPSHMQCPRFRRLMNLAAMGAIKSIKKPLTP